MGPYILLIGVAFIVVVSAIVAYTRRVADSALTDQFRAAEFIYDGKFPAKWFGQINRRLAWNKFLPGFLTKPSGTELALQKIDRLSRFFEKSPFFENAESREILLTKLQETRERWLNMSWEEITKTYSGK